MRTQALLSGYTSVFLRWTNEGTSPRHLAKLKLTQAAGSIAAASKFALFLMQRYDKSTMKSIRHAHSVFASDSGTMGETAGSICIAMHIGQRSFISRVDLHTFGVSLVRRGSPRWGEESRNIK
eukprot:s5635_g3.t1